MSEKGGQFLRVFDHIYSQWFSVPSRKPPKDNDPLTDEELNLAAEISDYCEQLFYKITAEQDAKTEIQLNHRPLRQAAWIQNGSNEG